MSQDILVSEIKPNPRQPRKHFEGIEELAESLKREGQLMPVLVRPVAGGYELVHGERRWRAAQLAGLQTLRAEVRDLTDVEAFKVALIENIQRQDLSPMEEAEAFKELTAQGMTQAALGALIGRSQQYIADRLALLRLPPEVKDLVTARAVTPSIARELLGIEDPRVQKRLAHKAADEAMTVKLVEAEKEKWQYKQTREMNRQEKFERLLEAAPVLAQYAAAVRAGELEPCAGDWVRDGEMYWGGELALRIADVRHEFRGQDWHWPRYSGSVLLTRPGTWLREEQKERLGLDEHDENMSVPCFSEAEWAEWVAFDEREALECLEFPGCECFGFWPNAKKGGERSVLERRTYDSGYGRFIVDGAECEVCPPGAVFVKRGWGKWCIVEMNDGQGERIVRRVFVHDHIGRTLVRQAVDTVDPFSFSDENFSQLALFKAQTTEVSWYYFRRKTIPREAMIAALEADLDKLRSAEALSDGDLEERVLDWLQGYMPAHGGFEWREGVISFPRLPDGTVDTDAYARLVNSSNAFA